MTTPHTDTLAAEFLLKNSGVALKNRLFKAATSEKLATPEGAPSEALIKLYETWARGGAAALITGNVMIDPSALEGPGNVIVEDRRHLPQLSRWAEATHKHGAQLWMQINHPGRQSPRSASAQPVAPSAVGLKGFMGLFATPRALEEAEILDLIARYALTAAVAKEAGFDGIQLHGAHGYLISQFLSPLTNLRDDAWGGTPDKRARFLIEIIRATRAAVGASFPISVKLNSADFQRGGFSEDDSMAVVEALETEGIDLLEISGGSYEAAAMFEGTPKSDSTLKREAYFLTYAEAVRQRTNLPLLLTGGLRTAEGMASAITSGAVDLVGLARPLILEPDLAIRILDGQTSAALKVDLGTPSKLLDTMVQAAWYDQHIRTMGRGESPDPGLGRYKAVFSTLVTTYLPKPFSKRAQAPSRTESFTPAKDTP